MGKMLATFKKKDKVALKLAYDGEREEEPETPSKQHPAIYLTCADVHESSLNSIQSLLTPSFAICRTCPRI